MRRLRFAWALALLWGCSPLRYARDRGGDLADCITLTVAAGPEMSLDIKATDAVHVGAGYGGHLEAGLAGGRLGYAGVASRFLPIAPFVETGQWYRRAVLDKVGGDWTGAELRDECYILHALSPAPDAAPPRPWVRRFDIEMGAIGPVGGRVGLSPGELVDFLLGLALLDPAEDDAPETELSGPPTGG